VREEADSSDDERTLDSAGVGSPPKPSGRSRLPFTLVGEREKQRRRKAGVQALREKNGGDVGLPAYAEVVLKDICVSSGLPNAPPSSSAVAAVIAENVKRELAALPRMQ